MLWDCAIVAQATQNPVDAPAVYSALRTLTGHTDSVLCLAICRRMLISGSSDLTVRVWSGDADWECLRTLGGFNGAVLSIGGTHYVHVFPLCDLLACLWMLWGIVLLCMMRGHRAAVLSVGHTLAVRESGLLQFVIKVAVSGVAGWESLTWTLWGNMGLDYS